MLTFRLRPAWQFWVGLLLIIGLALALRLPGYNFSLPYIDHPDEPAFYNTGREWRGLFNDNGYLTGYPPIYVWLNIGAQVVQEAFSPASLPATVAILRLLSAGFSLITLVCIALTARLAVGGATNHAVGWLAGWVAGWIAGAAWAVSPLVVENAIYATPDPLLYLLVMAALGFAAAAWVFQRPSFAILSVLMGGLAILDKYFTLTAVLPGLLVSAALLRAHGADDARRAWGRALIAQIAILALVGGIAVAGITVLPREGADARTSGLANILNFTRVASNLYHALLPLNPAVFGLVIVAGGVAYLFARRSERARVQWVTAALCALLILSVPILASTFSQVTRTDRMKDVLPGTAAACALLGIAAGQIMLTLRSFIRVRALQMAVPAFLSLLLVHFAGQTGESVAIVQNRLLPDARVALRLWADGNLTPGTVLVSDLNHKTFNPFWGGIVGRQWFDWWLADDFAARTPAGWQADHGISYAVLDQSAWETMNTTEAGRAWLAGVLPMNTFPPPSRSGELRMVRLWAMENPLDVRFGDAIHLLGYDRTQDARQVTFTFYWNAAHTPADNYSLFVHLLPAEGDDLLAQADGAPARAERPTLSWTQPAETLISLPVTLPLPPNLPAGDYPVRIGLYNYQTFARLPVSLSDDVAIGDALELTRISLPDP